MRLFVGKCDFCGNLSKMGEDTNAARLLLPAMAGQTLRVLVCGKCQSRLLERIEAARRELGVRA